MTYFPLHVHTHFSLLDGLSKPSDIANRCGESELPGSAVTDHGTISGHIDFIDTMNDAGKKPLLGCEFYVCDEDAALRLDRNRKLSHLCIIAKNDAGWREMVQMISMANQKEHMYYKPRLDLDRIKSFAQNGNLAAFSGHIGSHMSNSLFEGGDLSVNWKSDAERMAYILQDTFGKDNFFLEVQLMDSEAFPKQKIIADCIREVSKRTGIPCVATPDAHYARKEDAKDQRILLCSQMKTTLAQANKPEFGLSGFFRSEQYHIPSFEEMQQWHTPEELENTLKFADLVGEYKKVLRQPVLPEFPCPDGRSADEHLKQLCREGWREKIAGKVPKSKYDEYKNRVEHELEVLQGAGLSSYFLIVADIIDFVRRNQWIPGPGRGSASGSLVSYLTGITNIDPIPYGLIFERFYNAGRNVGGRVSMPDIDMDVPKYAREHVIDYMRETYGEDHVGQMITYTTMKGRGAIKDVLRAYGGMSFNEMNDITKNVIEEHKITDELQKMKEETGDSSIIRWCLENTPKKLEQWCRIEDDGTLSGELAEIFSQAIRLEGTKIIQSKHAAGVVISPEPIGEMFPLVLDADTGKQLVAFEMEPLEKAGGLKFDVLGITMLDKIMGVEQDLLYGEIHEIQRRCLTEPIHNR